MEDIVKQRNAILALLYSARLNENKHIKGFVVENDIKNSVGECHFNLGVLVELGYIQRDGYKYRITGAGVLQAETVS